MLRRPPCWHNTGVCVCAREQKHTWQACIRLRTRASQKSAECTCPTDWPRSLRRRPRLGSAGAASVPFASLPASCSVGGIGGAGGPALRVPHVGDQARGAGVWLPRTAACTECLLGDRPPPAPEMGLLAAPWAGSGGGGSLVRVRPREIEEKPSPRQEKSWAPGSRLTEVV